MVDSARERQVVSAVPTGLLIGGQWRPGGDRRDLPGRGPLDRPGPHRGGRRHQRRRPAGAGRGHEGAARMGRGRAPGAQRDPPPGLRPPAGAPGGPGAADDAGDGQAPARGARGDRLRGGVPPLVLRGGRAHRRRVRRRAQRSGALPRHAPTGGSMPPDHAVELPDGDGHPQDRPGGGGRMHHGRQARRADPAVDAGARRRSSRRPGFPTACSTWSPPRTPVP